jgi:hypothetical protein
MASEITYLIPLSSEEIRDTRMALIHFASEYDRFARTETFSVEAQRSYQANADLLRAVADRITAIIQRNASLDQEHAVRKAVTIIELR